MSTAEALRSRVASAPNKQAVARASGVSTKQIYRIAKGESTPNMRTAERITAALDAMAALAVSDAKKKAKKQRAQGDQEP